MILGALGFLGAVYITGKTCEAANGKAYPRLDKEKFDKENSRYGILHNLNREKMYKIAARSGVRPTRTIIGPEFGYSDKNGCKNYVNKYAMSSNDWKIFSEAWDKMVNESLEKERQQIIEDNEPHYQTCAKNGGHKKPGNIEYVYEIRHWSTLSHKEHVYRMNKIRTETFMKDIIVQEPILRDYGGSRLETWVISKPEYSSAETLYNVCCKKFGWRP